MAGKLEGMNVLVTGARQGIGRGIAVEMAKEGAHVAVNDDVADGKLIAAGRPGAIVNLGLVQAGMVLPGRTHYAPSKRAIEALTANLAAELAPHRIRVNFLHPGLIGTDMTAWVMKDPRVLPIVLDKIALHRTGQPSEIGRAAGFFASDDASYVTGQSLYVDGGFQIL